MYRLIDMKNIDIAVIGESMAGKTTWITSMFNPRVNTALRNICLENEDGQTKIKTYYKLVDSTQTGIRIDYIELVGAVICKQIENENFIKKCKPLYDFGIIQEIDNVNEDMDFVRIDLHNRDIDIVTFFEEIINNVTIAEMDIIRCVCISGPAHERVCEIMKDIGVETVTIRDTRGLMDETEKFYEKRSILKKNSQTDKFADDENDEDVAKILSALLADRGVIGADGCVFVTAGGNALNKKEMKDRYGFLFESILDEMPSFLLARSSILNYLMSDNFSIEKYREWMNVDLEYHFVGEFATEYCCDDYVKLLNNFGLFDVSKGLKNQVMKKHYKQMLLPSINTSVEKQKEWYIKSSHAAFYLIIEEIYKYKKELLDLIREEDELPQKIEEMFEKVFKFFYKKSYYKRNDGKFDTYVLKKQYVEAVADACICERYKGGLVGERGGLTTYIKGYGKTGKYAIDLLEAAYENFERIISELDNTDKVPQEYKIELYEMLKRICSKYSFSYASTNKMISTNFLYVAWCKLRQNDKINKNFAADMTNGMALDIVEYVLEVIILSVLKEAFASGEQVKLV